jgi:hypothetical protein
MQIRYSIVILALFASLALGQVTPSPQPEASEIPQHHRHEDDEEALPPSAARVASDSSVITIAGVCDHAKTAASVQSTTTQGRDDLQQQRPSSDSSSECKTIVTKAEFEKLVDALNPQMPGMVRRQLASSYPRLVLFADKARDLGLDQTPQFAERLQFATIQILAQTLNRYFEQQANNISDADLQDYYKANPVKFERADLMRILVPRQARGASKTASDAVNSTMAALAQKLQGRAAAGEDFQKLQKEAFEAAGVPSSGSPNVMMGKIAVTRLPVTQQTVFEMQPGQVSEVMADASGYYIYKMVSKEFIPLSQASREIRKSIASQRIQDSVNSLTKSLKDDLNPMYFGPTRDNTDGSANYK